MDVKEIRKTIQDLRAAANNPACRNCRSVPNGDTPDYGVLLHRAANVIEGLSHTDMIAALMRPTKICAATELPINDHSSKLDVDFEMCMAKRRIADSIGIKIMEHVKLETVAHEGREWQTLKASVWIYVPEEAEE